MTWLHRYVGLAIAGFLIVAGVTGVPLAFNAELEVWLSPELFRVEERATPHLTPDELIARAHRALPEAEVTGLNYKSDAADSVRGYVQPRVDPATGRAFVLDYDEVFLDPYDGRLLGAREWGAIRLGRAYVMPFLYKLHYTLHIPGRAGVLIFGIVALMWMFDCFVGFYLTLPARKRAAPARPPPPSTIERQGGKSWWQRWRPAWQIKRRAGFTRVNLDLHRAGGLWFWVVLFVLALTSVSLNLSSEVMRPAVGLVARLSTDPLETLPERERRTDAPPLSHAQAVAAARSSLPDANRNSYVSYLSYLAGKRTYWVAFMPRDKGEAFLQLEYAQVFVDDETGAVRAMRTYATGAGGDKFMDWQLPLHTGQILGLPGRILICISGVLVVMLSITGIIIWWKKRRVRTRRAMKDAPVAVPRMTR